MNEFIIIYFFHLDFQIITSIIISTTTTTTTTTTRYDYFQLFLFQKIKFY